MKKSRENMSLNIVTSQKKQDLQFWLEKSPEERIDAVEFLRTQYYCLSGHKSVPRFVPVIQIRAQQP